MKSTVLLVLVLGACSPPDDAVNCAQSPMKGACEVERIIWRGELGQVMPAPPIEWIEADARCMDPATGLSNGFVHDGYCVSGHYENAGFYSYVQLLRVDSWGSSSYAHEMTHATGLQGHDDEAIWGPQHDGHGGRVGQLEGKLANLEVADRCTFDGVCATSGTLTGN